MGRIIFYALQQYYYKNNKHRHTDTNISSKIQTIQYSDSAMAMTPKEPLLFTTAIYSRLASESEDIPLPARLSNSNCLRSTHLVNPHETHEHLNINATILSSEGTITTVARTVNP